MTPLEYARFALSLFESTLSISLRDAVGLWLVVGLSTVLSMGRLRTRTLRQKHGLVLKMALVVAVMFAAVQYAQGLLMMVHPSWWWHPFTHLWGWRAVECAELGPALRGLCAAEGGAMCLSDGAWDLLSGGALSSKRSDDVRGVEQGVQLAADSTLVVAALARDIIGSVTPFRLNVEALVPFWKTTSAVIFENDSLDGTREALAAWSAAAVGYTVRVIECEESPGCRLKHGTWYHSKLKQNQLASYRNRLLDDVIRHPPPLSPSTRHHPHPHPHPAPPSLGAGAPPHRRPKGAPPRDGRRPWSVHLAPRGATYPGGPPSRCRRRLRTLTQAPVGRLSGAPRPAHPRPASQPWPCHQVHRHPWAPPLEVAPPPPPLAQVMPYDISAFRPDPALFSPRLIALHDTFCRVTGGDSGGGDGAGFDRATCDFASPVHVAAMRAADQSNRDAPYGVASAFNGAALYPLEQLRLTGVRTHPSEPHPLHHLGPRPHPQSPPPLSPPGALRHL